MSLCLLKILEVRTLKQIAGASGYDVTTTDKIIAKKNKKSILNQIYKNSEDKPQQKYARISLLGKFSETIANNFRSSNVTPVFYCNHSLKTLIVNNKIENKDKNLWCGIYQTNCNDCDHC